MATVVASTQKEQILALYSHSVVSKAAGFPTEQLLYPEDQTELPKNLRDTLFPTYLQDLGYFSHHTPPCLRWCSHRKSILGIGLQPKCVLFIPFVYR